MVIKRSTIVCNQVVREGACSFFPTATTLPTFSGTSADFPAWQAIFLDACASASGTCTFGKGLLGVALPDAAWIAIKTADGATPPIATFAGHENSGLLPDLPGIPALHLSSVVTPPTGLTGPTVTKYTNPNRKI